MGSTARILHIVPQSEPTSHDSLSPVRAKHLTRTGLVSTEDTELATLASTLLSDALNVSGLRQADLAAVLNCSEGRVRAKLDSSNDGAPITVRDLLRLRKRAPGMWRAVIDALVALDGDSGR